MANTLKLGAGKWATGTDTVLAFNDENNNFKPLPFDFSRASSATVVNQSGLIETVQSGTPRIDFLGNTKGALLLEPQRSNIVIYSEAFDNSYWNKSSSSVLGGFASPSSDSPLSAFKIVEDTSTTLHEMWAGVTGAVAGSDFAYSVFAKKGERDKFYVGDGSAGSTESYFDLTNGTVLYSGANTNGSFIEDYGNGWYKCTSVYDRNNTTRPMTIGLLENSYTTGVRTPYTGDGTSGIYIYGAECEQGSYATSYIPTSGSAVTRVADSSSLSNDAFVDPQNGNKTYTFNFSLPSIDGVSVYDLMSKFVNNSNRFRLSFRSSQPDFELYMQIGGVNLVFIVFSADLLANTDYELKIVINNGVSNQVYLNGVLQTLTSDTHSAGNITLNTPFYLGSYHTALTSNVNIKSFKTQ